MTSEIRSLWCRLVIMCGIELISLYFHIHVYVWPFKYNANLMTRNNTEEQIIIIIITIVYFGPHT